MEDGENKDKVLLQKRSSQEKNFPDIHQATWAGKVDVVNGELEDTITTIKRECAEELGEEFYKNFDFDNLTSLSCSGSIDGEISWECSNYLGKIDQKLLNIVKLHDDAHPNFIFIGKNDKFYPISVNVDPKKNIVLFNDQYEILKKLLKI
jgi:hypothetical protein